MHREGSSDIIGEAVEAVTMREVWCDDEAGGLFYANVSPCLDPPRAVLGTGRGHRHRHRQA